MHRLVSISSAPEAPVLEPGTGSLGVARVGARSLVTRALAASPLRLLTPRNHGHAAWIYSSTFGGGLVDGDRLRLELDVGPRASALFTTQSATKVYRSPHGTSVDLAATVGRGALLVVAPDPVVCFAGASYRQVQRFDLDPAAGLVLIDALTSGRHASGERWQFDRYESRVTVTREGRLVLVDALTLFREDGDLVNRLGRFEALCLIVLLGPHVEREAAAILASVSALPVGRRSDVVCGASPVDDGVIVRIAGTSFEGVQRAVRERLKFVPALLGDDPWARKW